MPSCVSLSILILYLPFYYPSTILYYSFTSLLHPLLSIFHLSFSSPSHTATPFLNLPFQVYVFPSLLILSPSYFIPLLPFPITPQPRSSFTFPSSSSSSHHNLFKFHHVFSHSCPSPISLSLLHIFLFVSPSLRLYYDTLSYPNPYPHPCSLILLSSHPFLFHLTSS